MSCTMTEMRCTMSDGVPTGARMPFQVSTTKPGTTSAMSGTSGMGAKAAALVTPSARNLPART